MKLILSLLFLVAIPANAQTWECWVMQKGDSQTGDGSGYVTLMVSRNSLEFYRQRYPTPADGLDGVKNICRIEIAKFQSGEIKVIVPGKVDLTVTPPMPPPPPTPAEIARAAFLADVAKLSKLRTAILLDLKTQNAPDVTALRDKIRAAMVADPTLVDLLSEAQ